MSQPITAWRLRELMYYDPETGAFTRREARSGRGARVGDIAGRIGSKGYRDISVGRRYKAHRLAWLYMTGEWPEHQIDHINMNKDDNRWCNLREATNGQNRSNARPPVTNTSGFKYVSWHKATNKWAAYTRINGKQMHLGLYDTPWRAYAAACIAASKLQGDFARLYDDDIMIEPGPQSLGNDFLGI